MNNIKRREDAIESEWRPGKRNAEHELNGHHQARHEQVRVRGRIRTRLEMAEEDGTESKPGILAFHVRRIRRRR